MTQPMDLTAQQVMDRPVSRTFKSFKQALRPLLMAGVPAMLAVIGYAIYVANEPWVSTNNAYARVAKSLINARVSGQVVDIAVEDNQSVRKGQVLFRIDPQPLQIAVERAEAQLSNARLDIERLKAGYRQQQAELQSARDAAQYDERDFNRKKILISADAVSRTVYERAETDLKVSRQRIASAQQQLASTIAALDGNPNIAADTHPGVRAAKSQLDQAQLQLSYATVTAPADGIVAKVDDLQVGNYLNNGSPAFALMSNRDRWIEANFRETQVTHMRPGQHASITLDTYPNHPFKAHVISMSPGTGADFALLPPENATGNWVKVVQRVPVRLVLDNADPQYPLFSGSSATVVVDTGHVTPWWQPLTCLLMAGNGS